MPEVTYAEPTTRTPLHFDVMPPIKQASPITTATPTRQPFNLQRDAPGQLARPIDYHAQPKNIPSVQQRIKNDGATWKTIDVTPNSSARPRPRINTSQSVLAGTNVVSGNNFAQEQAAEAAAYYLGFALVGLWDGAIEGKNYPNEQLRLKRDAAEDAAYAIGQKTGDQLRDLGQQGKTNLEDLWKNRPQFEVPTIKIPKFEMPGFPDIFTDIFKPKPQPQPQPQDKPIPGQPKPTVEEPTQKPQPQIKEKDIPRTTELKPRPIPKNKEKQLRQLDLRECGTVSFVVTYSSKQLGEYFDPVKMSFKIITEPADINEIFNYFKSIETDPIFKEYKLEQFATAGGGSGSRSQRNIGSSVSYIMGDVGGGRIYLPGGSSGYPNYSFVSYIVIPALINNDKNSFNAILDDLGSSGLSPTVVDIRLPSQVGDGCPIGKPSPDPSPPPDPPEDCDCCMSCCPEIDYRKIQKMIEEELKKVDVTAAIPLSFQIRHEGDTPQMIIQCAERKSAASGNKAAKYASAMYPITVPHWKGGINDKPFLPPYVKGNWEGILVLNDNSKVTINAQNEAECTKILNAIKPWIESKMLQNSYFKGGLIKTEEPIKQIKVYPKYARYFGKGQKDGKPDWRIDFL